MSILSRCLTLAFCLWVQQGLAQTGANLLATCGNGVCETHESCNACAADCGNCCGDGLCDLELEGCLTCPGDCGVCKPTCGIDVNNATSLSECGLDAGCTASPRDICLNETACYTHKSFCGDGTCEVSLGETCGTCAADCGTCPPKCGDGTCEVPENCTSCAQDCGACAESPSCLLSGAAVGVKYAEPLGPYVIGTPEVADSKLSLEASGQLVGGTVKVKGTSCGFGPTASGTLKACSKWLGYEKCLVTGLSAWGSCSLPMIFPNNGPGCCDLENSCCTGALSASIGYGEKISSTLPLGPFECGADLGFTLSGELTVAGFQQGGAPSCTTQYDTLLPGLRAYGSGSGSCKITLAGQTYKSGLTLEGCSRSTYEVSRVASGTSVQFIFAPISVGYFQILGWSLAYEDGEKCVL
jgi:hypothetical protein